MAGRWSTSSPVGDADNPFARMGRFGMGGMDGMGEGHPRARGARRNRSGVTRPDVLPPGTYVQLVGLSDAPKNGTIARVESYDEQARRYVVALEDPNADGTAKSFAVKRENLVQVITSAKVVGTSQEALNDKVISAATYDKASKRYKCQGLKGDGTVLALKPEHVILPQDCRVTIENVKMRPALNGQAGNIVGVENERYVVQTANEAVRLRFGAVAAA